MKVVRSRGPEIFDIELEKDLLSKNRNLARENRLRFDREGILAIDVMGSIGSGKTSLIKAILKGLGMGESAAVIAGDLTTTIDAERMACCSHRCGCLRMELADLSAACVTGRFSR